MKNEIIILGVLILLGAWFFGLLSVEGNYDLNSDGSIDARDYTYCLNSERTDCDEVGNGIIESRQSLFSPFTVASWCSCSAADLNNDGMVDLVDLGLVGQNWGTSTYDMNGDGIVDISEQGCIGHWWMQTCGSAPTTTQPPVVPQPPFNQIVDSLSSAWTGFIATLQGIWDSLFADIFSIVSEHNVGETFTLSSSCSTSVAIDNDYSDGTVQKLYGRWALMKDGSKIDEATDWSELSSQSYSKTYSYTCDSDSEIVLATTIYKASNTYSGGSWGAWSVSEVANDNDAHTCGVPAPPSPVNSLEAIWNNFIGALENIWASIFGV